MKKLLLTIGLMLAASVSYAQTLYVTNSMAAGARTLVNEAIVANSITLFGTTNTIVRLYDGALTNVVGATTNIATFTTNIVTTYIGPQTGITNIWTNKVFWATAVAVAQTTNNSTPFASFGVTANQPEVTYQGPFIISKYLTVSNDVGGLNFRVDYRQP